MRSPSNSVHETSPAKEPSKGNKNSSYLAGVSMWDFFRVNKPWVLVKDGSFMGFFDYVPVKLRIGSWSIAASSTIAVILYLLSSEAIRVHFNGGWIQYFDSAAMDQDYVAFTKEWNINLVCFLWMTFVSWHVYNYSAVGVGAWATFTIWSWTIVQIRHGFCVVAPFWPSVKLPLEILRFPGLLSASLTFIIWNFVLFPLVWFLMKDPKRRKQFFGYMTNFRLMQLHVFNIFFATTNCVFLEPRRALHYGDVGAAAVMIVLYMFWYYCFLDRLGIHLYPIFSQRTPYAVCSYGLLVGICYGGYHGWQWVLQSIMCQS